MSEDPSGLLAAAWAALREGVADRRRPFHTPAIATTGLDGRPRLRVVVLRAVDPGARLIRVHTDRRSEKTRELARDPRLALLAYDAPAGLQVRAEGRAGLHHDDAVADGAWAESRPGSRATYGVEPGPGTPIPAGDAYRLAADADAGARENFRAVVMRVETLEVLTLASAGHRRARFAWNGADWDAAWLTP